MYFGVGIEMDRSIGFPALPSRRWNHEKRKVSQPSDITI